MNPKITEVIRKIIDGDSCYRLNSLYIRWGAVERDLNSVVSEAIHKREQEIVEFIRKKAVELRENKVEPMHQIDRDLICATEAMADVLSDWLKGEVE